jgi:hypothetical protein
MEKGEENVTTKQQYPMAFDVEGNPITLPPEAVAWRVRRGGGRRGRPRSVFDQETGLQLDVPLTASVDDLADRGCKPDRYRLEAVDGDGRVIAGLVAIVELPSDEEAEAEETATLQPSDPLSQAFALIEKVVNANSQTMQAMASAFGTVRPAHEQPLPILVEPPAAPTPPSSTGMQPEQLVQMIGGIGQMLVNAWKTGASGAAAGGGS